MPMHLDLSPEVDAVKPGIIALRRALHQHPELAFSKVWTDSTSRESLHR